VNCQETRAAVPEYVEGALAEPRRSELESHLPGCEACRAALRDARNLDRFLRGALPVPGLPEAHWMKLESRALEAAARPAAVAPPGRRGIPRLAWILGIAAALLVVVVGIVLTRPDRPLERESAKESTPPPPPEPAPPAPATAPERAPTPLPAPVATVLPGHADYVDRLTDEIIQVGLAETASDRVLGLIKAGDGRMSELRSAMATKDAAMAEDLAAAFTMIYRDGITAVLADREAEAEDLETARRVARKYAGLKAEALAKLASEAQGNLKVAIQDALLATREIAGP
jgi:hypothetical protein